MVPVGSLASGLRRGSGAQVPGGDFLKDVAGAGEEKNLSLAILAQIRVGATGRTQGPGGHS